MLADSLSSTSQVSQSAPGWLVFAVLLATATAVIPCLAWALRRRLPVAARNPILLEPVDFGRSQLARRSPRHAVLLHRTLMLAAFIAVLAVVLLPAVAGLRARGAAGLELAIALVFPTLLVALHARQREARR